MQGIAEAAHCPRVWVASQTTFRAVQHGEKGGICRWRFKGTSIAASPCGRMLLTLKVGGLKPEFNVRSMVNH